MNNRIGQYIVIVCLFFVGTSMIVASSADTSNQPQATILIAAPFTAQAPFGKWKDPRQQDGCEEAASLMAVTWARGQKTLAKAEAERHIIAISIYEQVKYGNYHDTSVADTLTRIINGYFKYKIAEAKFNASLKDIKAALESGAVVIIPVDGKKLKNPYFTALGPDRHKVLIVGYDYQKKEFITNDPGTRRGAGYRYSEKTIDAAWRDYPTGHHSPIKKIERNMIVISKDG